MSALLRELNRDIWEPFRTAYARLDASAYLSLYAPDLLRVEAGRRRLDGLADYATRVHADFTQLAENDTRLEIDFRFVERIAAGTHASERGIYRLTVNPPSVESTVYFGHFHTVTRKDDDRWRIVMDYDRNEPNTTRFFTAHAADDLAAFA